MSLLHYQNALAALLTNRSFRELFATDPRQACLRYALDDRELHSLTKIDTHPMSQHASLLGQARVMLALKALPKTAHLLGDDVGRTVEPFCDAHPPLPVAAPALGVEARRYATFLRAGVTDLGLPACIGEVAAYEAAMYEHSGNLDAWADANAFVAENVTLPSGSAKTMFARSAPAIGSHSRIEPFTHDVPAIIDALGRGNSVAPDAYARPVAVLFVKAATRRASTALRITPDVQALLAQCDGSATGEQIARRMSAEAQRRGLPEDGMFDRVFSLCEALRSKNVLAYRAPTTARTYA